jgi:predicted RNA-binding Zn-ribbon protein involved in translation (DUF1610 family)
MGVELGGATNQSVSCRQCSTVVPETVGIVAMRATDLFVCPACGHQEVWKPMAMSMPSGPTIQG